METGVVGSFLVLCGSFLPLLCDIFYTALRSRWLRLPPKIPFDGPRPETNYQESRCPEFLFSASRLQFQSAGGVGVNVPGSRIQELATEKPRTLDSCTPLVFQTEFQVLTQVGELTSRRLRHEWYIRYVDGSLLPVRRLFIPYIWFKAQTYV